MKKNYILLIFMLMSLVGQSQLYTEWTGSGNWNTGSNWNNGYGYGQLEFKGNGDATSNNDLNPASQWRLFFQGNQPYLLTGNQVNLFDFGGQNSWVLSQSTIQQNISLDISFSDSGTRPAWITSQNSGPLAFSGNIDIAGNVTGIYMANSTIGSFIRFSGTISGNGDIYVGRDQNFNLESNTRVDFFGANTYNGDTFVEAGTLVTRFSGNLGASQNAFISSGATLEVVTDLTVETVQERGSGNGGTVDIDGPGGPTLTLNGVDKGTIFHNNFNGPGSLIIDTSGTTELNIYGNNTLQGELIVTSGSTLKIIAGDGFPNAEVTVENGGTLILEGTSEKSFEGLTIDTGGTVIMNGMSNRLNVTFDFINNGTLTLSGTSGGDLAVTRNFTQNGILNNNSRAVFFEGSNNQIISGTSTPVTFDFLFVNKTGGTLSVNESVLVNQPFGSTGYSQSGGDVEVAAGLTFEVDNNGDFDISGGTFTLESTSTQYSSLIVNGTSTGDITYNRFVNSNANGNDLISVPVGSSINWSSFLTPSNTAALLDDGNAGPTTYAFAPFDKSVGDFVNFTSSTNTSIGVATGYRVATNSGTTLSFTGSPSPGIVSKVLTNSGPAFEEWNLIGNPYPAYLNVQDLLNFELPPGGTSNLDKLTIESGGLYGYDGNASDGWIVYNLANTTPSTVIAPGQGFFVATSLSSTSFDFRESMRRTGNSDDFIAGRNAQLTFLKLNASASNKSYTTEFYFNNNAGLGLDPGYDASIFGNAPDFALYSHLVEDNQGKGIMLQSLHPSDLSNVTIPLGVNANQGEQLTFSIAESTLPESVNVYLDDVVANTSTLLNTGDYVITPTTDLSGTGRFFLRAAEDALSTIDNSIDAINIFALNSTKELVVSGQLQENAGVALYDIQGRKVVATTLDATTLENRIDVSALSTGVYVVTVENNGQQKTQKVILK